MACQKPNSFPSQRKPQVPLLKLQYFPVNSDQALEKEQEIYAGSHTARQQESPRLCSAWAQLRQPSTFTTGEK